MKKRFSILIILIMVVAVSFFLLNARDSPSSRPQGWGGPVEARVVNPETRMVVEWDEYTGRFHASERVEIRARVGGYLQEVRFKDGQKVKKNDILFVIDQRPYKIALEGAQASHELAIKEFQRAKKLRSSSAISQEDYDNRLHSLRVAKIALDQAKLDLEFTEVKAPHAGLVSRNFIDEGNLISGGDANATLLTTLISVQPLEFYFEGSEADVLKYIRLYRTTKNPKQHKDPSNSSWPVYVKLQDENDFVHKGYMNFVSNEVDIDTGTKEVRAVFENESEILEPGLFGRLRITATEEFEALLIQDAVIGTEQTRKYVYIVGPESKATRKYLRLGSLQDDGFRIVKEGLDPGDQIIVSNLHRIHPGVTVKPITNNQENTQ